MDALARLALRPVDAVLAAELAAVLRRLMARKHAQLYFNQPVDWRALRLPNYPLVVRRPMDLSTVLAKLNTDATLAHDAKAYQTLEDFAADVRLVWKNAILFNGPQWSERRKAMLVAFLDGYKAARDMAKSFEDILAELHAKLDREAPPCPLKLRFQILLADLRRSPYSEWFRHSDDWAALGETYTAKVASPMDLDTVQEWVDSLDESSLVADEQRAAVIDELSSRLTLICKNAVAFNGDISIHAAMAKMLLITVQSRVALLTEALRESRLPPPPLPPREDRPECPTHRAKLEFFDLCNGLTPYEQQQVASALARESPGAVTERRDLGTLHATVDIDSVGPAAFAVADALAKDLQQRALMASLQDDADDGGMVLY